MDACVNFHLWPLHELWVHSYFCSSVSYPPHTGAQIHCLHFQFLFLFPDGENAIFQRFSNFNRRNVDFPPDLLPAAFKPRRFPLCYSSRGKHSEKILSAPGKQSHINTECFEDRTSSDGIVITRDGSSFAAPAASIRNITRAHSSRILYPYFVRYFRNLGLKAKQGPDRRPDRRHSLPTDFKFRKHVSRLLTDRTRQTSQKRCRQNLLRILELFLFAPVVSFKALVSACRARITWRTRLCAVCATPSSRLLRRTL